MPRRTFSGGFLPAALMVAVVFNCRRWDLTTERHLYRYDVRMVGAIRRLLRTGRNIYKVTVLRPEIVVDLENRDSYVI